MQDAPFGPDVARRARALAQRGADEWHMLTIETSSARGGVRLSRGSTTLAERTFEDDNSHARDLAAYLAAITTEASVSARELDLVLVNAGPGSHTGVRIGLVAARMVSWQAGALALGVNALDVLARDVDEAPGLLSVLIPCRRGESYRRDYQCDTSSAAWQPIADARTSLHTDLAQELADHRPRTLAGPAIRATAESIGLPDAQLFDSGWPTVGATHAYALDHARDELGRIANDVDAQQLVERWWATLRPLYLRRPLARTLAERQTS